MNSLNKAIKTYDIQATRQLLGNKAFLIDEASARIYLALAKETGRDDYKEKKGIKRVEATLILKFGAQGYTHRPN